MAVVFGQGTGGPASSLEGVTNAQLARLVKELTILGRSEAIDPVFATQRGTVTMTGDGDLKSQCGLRIGLGVATEADARLVIPDNIHIAADLAQLVHPGSGIVQVKQGRVSPVKFYRVTDEDISAIAALTGHWRPAPDQVLKDAFGPEYAVRWTERGGYLVPAAVPASAPVVTPPGADPDEFEAIVRSNLRDIDTPVTSMPGDDASPPRRRMREFIQRMGAVGVNVGAIVALLESEKMPVSKSTVHRWLKEDEAAGLVEPAGKFGRWKWRQQ